MFNGVTKRLFSRSGKSSNLECITDCVDFTHVAFAAVGVVLAIFLWGTTSVFGGPRDPRITLPMVEPGDKPAHFGLKLAERNKVFQYIQLDPSPQNWADQVLRVVVGLQEPWLPGDEYADVP